MFCKELCAAVIEESCDVNKGQCAVNKELYALNKELCAVNACNNSIEKRFKSFEDVWVIYFK